MNKKFEKGWGFKIAPSLITVAGLTIGLHGMRFIFAQEFVKAGLLIILAAVLDAFDGKVARFFNASSKFGSSLDSLSDFLNFGIVPSFLIYNKYFFTLGIKFGWIACVLYVTSIALRLARFSTEEMDGPFFKGVPAPGAAFIAMIPIAFENVFNFESCCFMIFFAAAFMALGAFLMLSNLKTLSFSRVSIDKKYYPFFILGIGVASSCFYSFPWASLLATQLVYLLSVFRKK